MTQPPPADQAPSYPPCPPVVWPPAAAPGTYGAAGYGAAPYGAAGYGPVPGYRPGAPAPPAPPTPPHRYVELAVGVVLLVAAVPGLGMLTLQLILMAVGGDARNNPDLFGQVADWTGTAWLFAAGTAALSVIMLASGSGPRYRSRRAGIALLVSTGLCAVVAVLAAWWGQHLAAVYWS